MDGPRWLTVAQASVYAGLSKDTIYTACERQELRHVRVSGRRTIRLRAEWVDAWLEQHAVQEWAARTIGPRRVSA